MWCVSRKGTPQELDSLEFDLGSLCKSATANGETDLAVTPRGAERRAISFSLRLPSAAVYADLRKTLLEDPRVQFVF